MAVLAFVDESMSLIGEGSYLIASVVVVRERIPETRHALRGMLLRRQRRFHWRNESPERRLEMLELAAELEVFSYAYVK
jgi:hypothetical protein